MHSYRQLLRMRSTKVVARAYLISFRLLGFFLALDSTSTRIAPSTSGRKYREVVNNAVFIRNESLFVVLAAATSAFPGIKAPAAVATQHIPCGLSNTDHRIWKNISHVPLWEILMACIPYCPEQAPMGARSSSTKKRRVGGSVDLHHYARI